MKRRTVWAVAVQEVREVEPDEDGEIRNTYRSIKDAPQYPRGLGMSKMALQGML
ncbi:hypothetical protein BANRA_01062 [Escherichia coli]|nr:hypothetical protein BANRA_01062 [Escherichia coli]